jgi:chromosome segregation ATPase
MALEKTQPQEVDLDRTDRLPILDGTTADEDVADDAVRLDYSPAVPSVKSESPRAAGAELPPRAELASRADLASRAESVRSGEGRIARQNAEPDPLKQAYDKARGAEAVVARTQAQAPAADFAGLRAKLESEQARSRELERALAEKTVAAEAARVRLAETLRDAERYQNESRALRGTLTTRDATLIQVQHSLAERDAQLNALQREHAKVVPALEERSRRGTQLEAELRTLRGRYESTAGDLKNTQQSVAALTSQLKAGKDELRSARRELDIAKLQAATYLEHLRTREWRRGFAQLDAQPDSGVLQAERDQLRARVVELEAKLATRDEAIAKLKAAATDDGAQRSKEHQSAAEKARAELSAQVHRLQSEAQTWEDEKAVLLAHLQEARRLIEPAGPDAKRLTAELAAKTRALEQLNEDNRSLRAALERARSSLEEREFLIRRLEHSETNGANMSGRHQAHIERPDVPAGNVAVSGGNGVIEAPMECTGELIRIDGQRNTAHFLARRTRIGRAPDCELQIESTSVSRHHALVLVSGREVIIEDLNSTNGVLVNGRRISRQLLNDGDLLTIGEAQFRLKLKPAPGGSEAPAPH